MTNCLPVGSILHRSCWGEPSRDFPWNHLVFWSLCVCVLLPCFQTYCKYTSLTYQPRSHFFFFSLHYSDIMTPCSVSWFPAFKKLQVYFFRQFLLRPGCWWMLFLSDFLSLCLQCLFFLRCCFLFVCFNLFMPSISYMSSCSRTLHWATRGTKESVEGKTDKEVDTLTVFEPRGLQALMI